MQIKPIGPAKSSCVCCVQLIYCSVVSGALARRGRMCSISTNSTMPAYPAGRGRSRVGQLSLIAPSLWWPNRALLGEGTAAWT